MNKHDIKEFISFTFGEESHLNIAGKIIGAPFIILAGVIIFVCEFLFKKRG